MSTYITSIGTANPAFKVAQKDVLRFMIRAHNLNMEQAHQLEVLYRSTGIKTRYSVLEDYTLSKGYSFYADKPTLEPFPTTSQRMSIYKKEALSLSIQAIEDALAQSPTISKGDITHLIAVSCTGLFAPGLDIQLVDKIGLSSTVQRTGINFMGCYAAFNAMKVAHYICSNSSDAQVLIVCAELCSLHFQKEPDEDNLLANALFGDGAAALIMSSSPCQGVNLKVTSFYSDIVHDSQEAMSWNIGDHGFEMKLSRQVPDYIESSIEELINRLNGSVNNEYEYYAIHPGGKKILHVIEDKLGLDKTKNRFAHQVLREYGNMSSPTVLFVLRDIRDQLTISDDNKNLLALAFGPGLTLESMVFKIITVA